jgi:RNA polymerase sigma-70 factor (ECF subfamily)
MANSKEDLITLIEEHKKIIYKVCYVYSSGIQTRDDLFQETVINLWKAWPKFRGDCKVQTWIYRITLNTCISFLRKSKSKPKAVPLTRDIESIAQDQDLAKIQELYRLISRLNGIEKAIVLLYIEEKTYEEIAQIIGISKSNVAVKLFRIKEKLRIMSQK